MGSATSSIPPFFASTTLNAPHIRAALSAAFADAPSGVANASETGVLPGGGNTNTGFVATSNGSSAAPSVSVAPGQCVIQRSVGGTYVCTLPTAVTVTLDTPLPTSGQTRIDVLCASVVDGEADGGTPPQTNTLTLSTVMGTSGASPSAPSVPAGFLALYQVTVNNAGTLTIADVRTYTRGVGGLRPVAPGDVRAGSQPADLRIFVTGEIDAWLLVNATWQWVPIVAPAVWTQQNVTWSYAGPPVGTVNFGGGSTSICRFKRAGNDLDLSYEAVFGTLPAGGFGSISTQLPNGWVGAAGGRDQWVLAHLYVNDGVSGFVGDFPGQALIQSGSSNVRPFFPQNINTTRTYPYKIATTGGSAGGGVPLIGGGFPQGGRLHVVGRIEIAS